ncbi:acyl carrier protein [Cristinia sonorae]|uniref:Acyl carrier protein n=1 Tax=Cristinia sonorae TaxID=1940300 RepID=A0A8K0URI5_9AGAR|nr:acyl carrier protein [Cristinia sonorae]
MSFLRLAVRNIARTRLAAPAAVPVPRNWAWMQAARYSASAGLSKDAITARVLDVLKGFEQVDQAKLTPTSTFTEDLGLDSLTTVEVVMAVEEEFSIEIPDAEAEEIQTVQQAIDYIAKTPEAH